MRKRKNLAKLIAVALVIGAAFPVVTQAAEEDPTYSMEQVTVTAMRDQSPDLTTPAYVHILTQEQLQATGTTNLIEALKYQEGISYSSQNPQGHSGGGMSSRLIIRGVEKGTLVMVNGVPVNLNGWYQLDSIPLSNIDKVEIVSGGASVMYGSEAFGGVINIITKKKVENSISTSFGNYGLQQHNLNMQMGKFAFSGQYSEVGTIRNMTGANGKSPNTAYYTNFDGDQLTNVVMTYVFDPHFSLRHEYTEDHIDRSYHLALNDNLRTGNTALMHDVDKKNLITALYENNSLKMTAYYNQRKLYDEAKLSTGLLNGAYTDTISELGSDIQNSWQTGFGKLLAGVGSQHETYQKEIHNGNQAPIGSLSRDNYSFYLQSTHALNPRDSIILGGRQEWVQAENNNNHNEFLPQVQFLRRISDHQSWYVNINKSFRMPTFTELYVNNSFLRSNPNLLPETGWSYETGLKNSYPDADLKVALYYMNITDKIAYLKQGNFSYAQNFQKFKNTGLETHYEKRLNEHWRYDIGGSYSNPLQAGDDGVYTSVFNRLQITGGLTYMQDRWTTRLSADYLAMRANDLKPMLPVSLAISYKMSPNSSWILNIDNLFDRRDITTNDKVTATAPAYYAMPRSFRLTYSSKF